jgi:hypothetical protein
MNQNTGTAIYGHASEGSPLFGQKPNLFHLWLSWLKDLGGQYEPMRDFSERKPGGRRDPDRKPRQYALPADKYAITSKGSVVRLEFGE